MSSEASKSSQKWPMKSFIEFEHLTTKDHYTGTVNHFQPRPEGAEIGIENVTVWKENGCEYLDSYKCNLEDIKMYFSLDDQDKKDDDGATSKSTEGNVESRLLDPPSK